MQRYEPLLRDLQRLCVTPDGPIARGIRAIATLREEVQALQEELEYLREYAKRRGWDCFKEETK